MNRSYPLAVGSVLLACLLLAAAPARGALKTLVMATGSPDGVYYPLGQAIAQTVARYLPDVYIQVIASKGSVDNLNLLRAGKADLAIAQADRVCEAYAGKGPWAKAGGQKNLRFLFNVVNETVTIVTKQKTGIRSCRDLAGRKVALGAKGSGTLGNALDTLACCGLSPQKLGKAVYLNPNRAANLLDAGRIDAFFTTTAHPNWLLECMGDSMKGLYLVGVKDCDCLRKRFRLYSKGWIPCEKYKAANQAREISTCGVWALMVTTARLPVPTARQVMQVLKKHLAELQKKHLAIRYTQSSDHFGKSEFRCAPMHPGAQ